MLQVNSVHGLHDLEAVMRRAVERRGALLLAVSHLGQLFRERAHPEGHDAVVFTVCHAELSAALLAADIRLACFIPCRVAAWSRGEGVTLEAMSPREFARLLNRPDLDRLVMPLETMLREIMEEAARPAGALLPPPRRLDANIGATEGQVSVRGPVPQRIDCRGTKIEELAGTGQHDSPGG